MPESLLPAALWAVAQGFHVFPVEPGEKTPARIYQDRDPDDAPWTVKWSEVATNDVATVVTWWTYQPRFNVGIACKPSGLLVVDCDVPKAPNLLVGTPWAYLHDVFGEYVEGAALFDQVAERYGGDPVRDLLTFSVETGSGGLHLYYRWPADVQSTQDSVVKGVLDVRGNGGDKGGYVLGPGSVTASGEYGRWKPQPVLDAPPWLVSLCQHREPPKAPKSPYRQPRSMAFHGLVDSVRNAFEGNRNNALLWAARSMCEDGATEEECCDLLVPAAIENGLDGGERQARQTIKSAYRLQVRKMG